MSARYRMAEDRGTALIVVMWVSLGLVSLALFFGHSMMFEYRAADNRAAGLAAAQAVEGARRYVAFLLENLEEPGVMPEGESYEAEEAHVGDASFWLIGRGDGEVDADDAPVFGLIDEASKLNLNTATLDMLQALPNMTTQLAAAIVDWRDTDGDVSPDGAESGDYMLGEPAYYCKDGEFETLEELRLLMGCDFDMLYGKDRNRNGVLESWEEDGESAATPRDASLDHDALDSFGLLEYLTVYSREPNVREDGSKRVNVRTAPDEELAQVFRQAFGGGRADAILEAVGNARQGVRSVLEFYIHSGMTPEEFAQVDDALSVSDAEYVEGLVNVNTASAEVLACLPGIGEEYASQLTASRNGKSTSEELDSVAWVAEALGPESAIQAGPYITVRTYQFTADVVGVGHHGRGFRRESIVFDASGRDSQGTVEVKAVCRRGLARLGWPLGTEMRVQLDTPEQEAES